QYLAEEVHSQVELVSVRNCHDANCRPRNDGCPRPTIDKRRIRARGWTPFLKGNERLPRGEFGLNRLQRGKHALLPRQVHPVVPKVDQLALSPSELNNGCRPRARRGRRIEQQLLRQGDSAPE